MDPSARAMILAVWAALNADDPDALIAHCHADVTFTSQFARVEGSGTYHGHDGLRRYFRDLRAAWPDATSTILRLDAAGDGCAVVVTRGDGHGRASGMAMSWTTGSVLRWRDGRLIDHVVHADPADAYRAAWLDPPADLP